jgi:2-iminobutanoate/2-iminopropanoate deaminase
MAFTHIDPPGVPASPAYANGILVESGRTLYIGGQNGLDASDTLVQGGAAQSRQAMQNVLAILREAGGDVGDLVKLTILYTEEVDLREAYGAVADLLTGTRIAVTGMGVRTLGRPGALVEVDAIAVLG